MLLGMDKVEELLTRGVEKIYPTKEALEKLLRSGKRLKIYQGFDPTGTQMHIGHMIGLRKLRQFQDLDHHVIFLIGDGTGLAGDPSGKTSVRKKIHSLILSTHEDKPGILRKLAESFENEGVSIEEIRSERVSGDVNFRIVIDEKKYSPKVIAKVIRSLGSQGFFTNEELRLNAKSYVEQASRIVRFDGENPIQIMYNGDWLNNLSYQDILNIVGRFSLQQLSERDLFRERMKQGKEVNMREFLYPVFQAYDSVVLNVDLEVGGSDQTFNMLAGRTLAKTILGKEKFVLTTPLLTDSKGTKVGKTEGNVIAITNPPGELYGKIMSLSDDVIVKALEYLTDVSKQKIEETEKAISGGQNPLQFKKMLAFEIVKQLNGGKKAEEAQSEFESIHQQGAKPKDVDVNVQENVSLTEAISALVSSKSQAKRLIGQGAVEIDGQVVKDGSVKTQKGQVLKIGKKTYAKVEK